MTAVEAGLALWTVVDGSQLRHKDRGRRSKGSRLPKLGPRRGCHLCWEWTGWPLLPSAGGTMQMSGAEGARAAWRSLLWCTNVTVLRRRLGSHSGVKHRQDQADILGLSYPKAERSGDQSQGRCQSCVCAYGSVFYGTECGAFSTGWAVPLPSRKRCVVSGDGGV